MGKPFSNELNDLPRTYAWALEADVSALSAFLARAGGRSLVTIGSGGSLTAADFACALHQIQFGHVARSLTPLELVGSPGPSLRSSATLILSAGGRNPDILSAAERAAQREPRQLVILCATVGSPLAEIGNRYDAEVVEFDPPAGRDGFLATNTLLGFLVLLYRGYMNASREKAALPSTLHELVGARDTEALTTAVDSLCEDLWTRDTLVVLHGPSTRASAIDLESKFTEAALGSLQLADYRNYAHGRHHWLAKRASSSAVLALVAEEDADLATRTLELLPEDVPIARLEIPHRGFVAGLAGLLTSMHVVASAGRARGIDPGRPGVPAFGRKLYNLRALGRGTHQSWETRAIERKAGQPLERLTARGEAATWNTALDAFIEGLSEARFGAVIFDYDGTICDRRARYQGLGDAVVEHLVRLLEARVLVGIATGRGGSVEEEFRKRLDASLHSLVWIGYYNGGYLRRLDQGFVEADVEGALDPLSSAQSALAQNTWIAAHANLRLKRPQLSVVSRVAVDEVALWENVVQVLASAGIEGVTVVRSSHSVDVVAPGVSKTLLVKAVRQELGGDRAVLCVGDRGRWPGNDHALLAQPHSLSVDEVSADPKTCWNIAPPGLRGVRAVLGYLESLSVRNSSARIKLTRTRAR